MQILIMKMGQKIIKYIAIGFILIAMMSIAISIFSVAREITRIPEEAMIGLEPKSYKILGNFKLSDWSNKVSDQEYITIFQGEQMGNSQNVLRAYYDDGISTKYVGQLDNQLGLESVKTLLIDIKGEKCIVGWISLDVAGKLYIAHIERPEKDKDKWMEAQKESTIEKNLFIIPITESDVDLWNEISMFAIQTKESLKRGFDGNGSYYEIEKSFTPPTNVSNLYKTI